MKVTFRDVRAFCDIYDSIAENKLPLGVAYKLAQIQRKAEEEMKFYQTRFASYIDTYAVRDEANKLVMSENGNIKIQPDKLEECTKKLNELDEMEVQFNVSLKLNDFGEIRLTPREMSAMLPFIEE